MEIRNITDKLLNKLNLFYYLSVLFRPHIWVRYAIPRWKDNNCNWGDDVNAVLCKLISGKEVLPYQYSWLNKPHFLCIGSIIQWYSAKDAIIWGSGLLQYTKGINPPKKVLAVRGPLTRQCLLDNGIECPEIYGDPALLFPEYYRPTIHKQYHVGIICHQSETEFLKKKVGTDSRFLFIDVRHYGKWTDFIDKILSCTVVLSSSLHGVIVADAYDIPNQWCQFTDYVSENAGFKFKDYFLSVCKHIDSPLKVDLDDEVETIENGVMSVWEPPKIDIQKLLDVCPFKK